MTNRYNELSRVNSEIIQLLGYLKNESASDRETALSPRLELSRRYRLEKVLGKKSVISERKKFVKKVS